LTPAWRVLPAALRVNQWTKNSVVLAAVFFAMGDRTQRPAAEAVMPVVAAALLFCLVSSGIYLVNDVHDVESDRRHPLKRHRPVASGRLGTAAALALAAALLAAGLGGSLLVNPVFTAVLAAYAAIQFVYTFALKRLALVDIIVIAAGFVLRAVAGAVAIDVAISPWLLLCAFLLALFLAICKRRHERILVDDIEGNASTRESLAGYDRQLLDQLVAIVSSATIVCYAIYTLWPTTVDKFGTPMLALTIPFVIFGMFRYLDLVYRHEKGDRPEKILLSDAPLLIDIVLYGAAVLAVFAVWGGR
jgi:4-hydroxybenzoate polyprenyltransferase